MHKFMTIEMPDASKWQVPVEIIARHRAEYYANEFDGDVERSLKEDTIPMFESDNKEIANWAVGNMDWSDFKGHQVRISDPEPVDYQEGWGNGEKGYKD